VRRLRTPNCSRMPVFGISVRILNGNVIRLSVDFTAHTGFVPDAPREVGTRSRPDRKPSCRALRPLHQAFRASRSACADWGLPTGRCTAGA
jgi:hypothetical protein